jgi:isomerase DpgB
MANMTHNGPVLRIDGTRPLSDEAIQAVRTASDQAEGRQEPGIVLAYVCGAPDVCGAPEEIAGDAGPDMALVSRWERAVRRLERGRLPVVAVATGDCGGTALDVLLAADFRIATSPTSRLRLMAAGGRQASWPGMAGFRLVQQAGVAAVRSALLFGTPVTAADALALRLVDEITGDIPGAVAAASRRLAAAAGPELAIRRQLMFDATWMSFEDALGPHLAACDRTLRQACGRAA